MQRHAIHARSTSAAGPDRRRTARSSKASTSCRTVWRAACIARRLAPLATAGFYVASRAAQWRPGPDGGYWDALHDDSTDAVECRADRGRHGSVAGDWYAGDGTGDPWTRASAQEIPWDRLPWADPYIFFSGNYLNYLHADVAVTDRSVAEVMSRRLAQALAATAELDVALCASTTTAPMAVT